MLSQKRQLTLLCVCCVVPQAYGSCRCILLLLLLLLPRLCCSSLLLVSPAALCAVFCSLFLAAVSSLHPADEDRGRLQCLMPPPNLTACVFIHVWIRSHMHTL